MTRRNRDNPFEKMFEQMNQAMQNMHQEMQRMMQDVQENGADFKGYTVTKLPGQEPRVTSFGDTEGDTFHEPAATPESTHVDVMDEDDEIHVVADMPGVEKEDIELTVEGSTLNIRASSGDRSYDERVDLGASVDPDTAEATYNNGVVQVTLEKTDEGKNIEIN